MIGSELVGKWQYGSKNFSKPTVYRISLTDSGVFLEAPQPKVGLVSGALHSEGCWLQADLLSSKSVYVGKIRLRRRAEDDTILSNFKAASKEEWGKDIVARRVPVTDVDELGAEDGIQRYPQFVRVPAEVVPLIAAFADEMQRSNSAALTEISGRRREVFLLGVKSEPFQKFVSAHSHARVVLDFLEQLRINLAKLARSNNGVLSEDIVALVGGEEMQVPHVDLKRGQVQVIVALETTIPTMVYDPAAPRPSLQQTMESIGVGMECATAAHLGPLVNGGSPLVLPVELLYQRMIPACDQFRAGDAVHIPNGIVHAGPKCQQVSGLPRIIVFSTYTTLAIGHYNVNHQYKMWDWASYQGVPAMVAYVRLHEVYKYAQHQKLSISPWTHYSDERFTACKALCTTAGLHEDVVEALVEMWRSGRRPAALSYEAIDEHHAAWVLNGNRPAGFVSEEQTCRIIENHA